MTTLTLDKSKKALAVLAWRKGMTEKPFRPLAAVHNASKQVRVEIRKTGLTIKQQISLKRR